jgi:ribosomal-protein-alanine N-acetyltransferase
MRFTLDLKTRYSYIKENCAIDRFIDFFYLTIMTNIITERLLLNEPVDQDVEALFLLRSNPVVNKYLDRPVPSDERQVLEFIHKIRAGIEKNENYYWAIRLKNDPLLIGTICLWNISADRKNAEIGYEMNPAFQRKGFMKEALEKVVGFAYDQIGIEILQACSHRENIASINLLQRCNFQLQDKKTDEEIATEIIYFRKR